MNVGGSEQGMQKIQEMITQNSYRITAIHYLICSGPVVSTLSFITFDWILIYAVQTRKPTYKHKSSNGEFCVAHYTSKSMKETE